MDFKHPISTHLLTGICLFFFRKDYVCHLSKCYLLYFLYAKAVEFSGSGLTLFLWFDQSIRLRQKSHNGTCLRLFKMEVAPLDVDFPEKNHVKNHSPVVKILLLGAMGIHHVPNERRSRSELQKSFPTTSDSLGSMRSLLNFHGRIHNSLQKV